MSPFEIDSLLFDSTRHVLYAGTHEHGVWYAATVSTPVITGISPTSGAVGAEVTIAGANFGAKRGTSVVKFGGTPATEYTSWSETRIRCKVPVEAETGPVRVTTEGGTSNGATFAVIPRPAISSISPTSGPVGTEVRVNGTDFGTSRGSSVVEFHGVEAARYTLWTDTQIRCKVPRGATTGAVKVTTKGGTSNGKTFTVTRAPAGSSISPTSGVA